GERVLLPEVRKADPRTLIVADGFSCRTQIEQGAGRRAIHHAQVIQLALERDRQLAAGRARATVIRPAAALAPTPETGMIGSGTSNGSLRAAALKAGSLAGGLLLAYMAAKYVDIGSIRRLMRPA
ncbi:MAG TPA: hypothetical protein VJ718_10995, partial [Candidatus Binataceae bacterium]|nr:hypothetical protein [Candidatus Binataceae bacterium]